MIEHTSWRNLYWVGVGYTSVVVLALTFVMEETMYDRHLSPVPPRHATGLRYRFDTLIGITGARMAKYRPSLWAGVASLFDVLWRPHALMVYVYVGWIFGCGTCKYLQQVCIGADGICLQVSASTSRTLYVTKRNRPMPIN